MKTILLCITGSISAYKAADIGSFLSKAGFIVIPVLSKDAAQFITPLTLQTICRNNCYTDQFDQGERWKPDHIELAQKADLILVAPATANIISKLTYGITDDLITTTILASTAPVMIAPAMNTVMYNAPVIQENIAILKKRGVSFIDPASGILACGDEGVGKLAPVDEITNAVTGFFNSNQKLSGKKVLISAGSTREYIDPVRFISNPATGKMGLSLAEAATSYGADVGLVAGNITIKIPDNITSIPVVSADEMYQAMNDGYDDADIVIMSAAVGDFRPKHRSHTKTKKETFSYRIDMEPNIDILKALGGRKKHQYLVGFAAETIDDTTALINEAIRKLKAKNLDMIVANNVNEGGAGFGTDTNHVFVVTKDMQVRELQGTKKHVSEGIFDIIAENTNTTTGYQFHNPAVSAAANVPSVQSVLAQAQQQQSQTSQSHNVSPQQSTPTVQSLLAQKLAQVQQQQAQKSQSHNLSQQHGQSLPQKFQSPQLPPKFQPPQTEPSGNVYDDIFADNMIVQPDHAEPQHKPNTPPPKNIQFFKK